MKTEKKIICLFYRFNAVKQRRAFVFGAEITFVLTTSRVRTVKTNQECPVVKDVSIWKILHHSSVHNVIGSRHMTLLNIYIVSWRVSKPGEYLCILFHANC